MSGQTAEQARCPTCRDVVVTRGDGCCVWCDTQTGAAIPIPPPPGPGGPRPALRSGEPGYGAVCPHCDGPKAPGSHMCRPCRRSRGHRTPDRELGVTTHRAILIEEDVLEDARRIYATGLGLRRVARLILPCTGYASEHSCAVSLHQQFRRRGWPLRPRRAASADATTTHGQTRQGADRAAYRRAHRRRQPPCAGTTSNGASCRMPAARGREHCRAHDPALLEQTRAEIAAVRARISMLDRCAGTVEHHERAGQRCMHRVRRGETHCWRHAHQAQEAA